MADTKEAGEGVEFEDGESYTFNMKEQEEDTGFAPLPAGTYLVTIESHECKPSKSSGNLTWYMTYAIAEGEFAEKNRKVFDFTSLKAEQRGRVKKFIKRVAPEMAELETFDPKKVADEGLLIGKQLKVKLKIEPGTTDYPGDKNRVQDYFAPGAGASGSFSMS